MKTNKINFKFCVKPLVIFSALLFQGSAFSSDPGEVDNDKTSKFAPTLKMDLPLSTQGPLWPPGEFVDENGDFVVIGNAVKEVAPGVIGMVPGQAILVSKDTVPPLDENGVEDFRNPFAAPYNIIKELDLSPGSPDNDIVLYTNSYGPPSGNFGGAGRIPREGESKYNLNSRNICLDLFPTSSQKYQYKQPSFPLHEAPLWGMQGGRQVAYDPDTGMQFDPNLGSGSQCPMPGCSGENLVDEYPIKEAITLGRYLEAEGKMEINLSDFDELSGGYTAADFSFKFEKLLPNSVYTIWALRTNFFHPGPAARVPDPITLSNIITSDKEGNGKLSFKLSNPFPSHQTDNSGTRIIGIVVVYHSDQVSWSACPGRTGPGVETHSIFSTMVSGLPEVTDLVTVPTIQ